MSLHCVRELSNLTSAAGGSFLKSARIEGVSIHMWGLRPSVQFRRIYHRERPFQFGYDDWASRRIHLSRSAPGAVSPDIMSVLSNIGSARMSGSCGRGAVWVSQAGPALRILRGVTDRVWCCCKRVQLATEICVVASESCDELAAIGSDDPLSLSEGAV